MMDKENEVDNETYFSQKPVKQLVTTVENKINIFDLFQDKLTKKTYDAQIVPDADGDLFGDRDESDGTDDQKEVDSEMDDQNPNVLQNNELESSNSYVAPTKTARNVNKPQLGRLSKKKLDLDSQMYNSDGNAQIETSLGVWVECVLCMKWRYLKNVNDPSEIIENWNCTKIPNKKCNAEPEDWTNEMDAKCVRNKFVRGSIVWAKFTSLPWWPGIIDNDPDEGRFFRTDGNMIPTEYHVVFWDNKIWRSWIAVKKMQPFGPNGGTRTNEKRRNYYSRRIEAAKNLAAEASQMAFKERIEKCGFATYVLKGTYFGKHSRKSSAEIDKGNLPKRSRKLSPRVEKENLRKHSRKPLDKITKKPIGKVTFKIEKDESDVSSNSPKSQKELVKKEKDGRSENDVKDEEHFGGYRGKPKFVPQFKKW